MNIKSEVLNIQQLFVKYKSLEVPEYQRPYSWEVEQWQEMWEDLESSVDETSGEYSDYFLGSIVLLREKEDKKAKWFLVDGQQRLATLTMLAAVLRDAAKNPVLKDNIQHGLIVSGSDLDKEKVPYLKLGTWNQNQKVLERIQEGDPQTGKIRSSDLERCYYFFKEQLQRRVAQNATNERQDDDFIREKARQLRDKIYFVVTEVSSDEDAYLLFETLNDRGLNLSQADLIKNHLFSIGKKGGGKMFETVKAVWDDLLSKLESQNSDGKSLVIFLRYFWISESGKKILERELYREIKDHLDDQSDKLAAFLKKMEEKFEYFTEIFFPDSPSERRKKDGRTLYQLLQLSSMFGFRSPTPLLLELWPKLKDLECKIEVVRIIQSFMLQYATFAGQATNVLERYFADFCKQSRDLQVPEEIVAWLKKELRALLPEREKIWIGFRELEPRASIARALLWSFENRLLSKLGRGSETLKPPMEVNLEHVYPRHPSQEEPNLEEVKYRLGNLTLLSEGLNKRLKNEKFEQKKTEYEKSSMIITSGRDHSVSVLYWSRWDRESIEGRQKAMEDLAKEIWGSLL